MASTAKSNPRDTSAPESGRSSAAPLAGFVQKGIESLVDVQKRALDVAAEQNSAAIKTLRECVNAAGSVSAAVVAGAAEQIVGRFVEAQKNMLDYAVEQSGIAVTAAESANAQMASGLAASLQRGIDAAAASQQSLLDLAAKQNAVFGAAAAPAALLPGVLLEAMRAFVQTQKNLCDIASDGVAKLVKAGNA